MKKSKEIIVPKYAFSWKSGRNHPFLSWKKGNVMLFRMDCSWFACLYILYSHLFGYLLHPVFSSVSMRK